MKINIFHELFTEAKATAPERQGEGQGPEVVGFDVSPAQDRRAPRTQGNALPDGRHDVLLRLRAHAPSSAHTRRRKVLCRLRDTREHGSSVAVHAPHV